MENFKNKHKELFNLFELLNRPVNKKERKEFTKINHNIYREQDYRAIRQEFIYPQLLRILLKAEKAERLQNSFRSATAKKDKLSKFIEYTTNLETKEKLSVYHSFAIPALLAEKEDRKLEQNNDFWIWKNLASEIIEALKNTCTKENLEYYSEKYSREKINFLIETLVEIANRFLDRKISKKLIWELQNGEIKPEIYNTRGLKKYEYESCGVWTRAKVYNMDTAKGQFDLLYDLACYWENYKDNLGTIRELESAIKRIKEDITREQLKPKGSVKKVSELQKELKSLREKLGEITHKRGN